MNGAKKRREGGEGEGEAELKIQVKGRSKYSKVANTFMEEDNMASTCHI
jgi:hypothetical protein